MKHIKKALTIFIALLVFANFSVFGVIRVFSHPVLLEVSYDDCVADGIDETWYTLNTDSSCFHLSHADNTIKYYFEDKSEDGTYMWTTDVSETVANEIKTAYANSMKKWNNVYFYSFDGENVVKNKIINVVEGTEDDHNLTIYPISGTDDNVIAAAAAKGGYDYVGGHHSHWSQWKMKVYVDYFYVHDNFNSNYVAKVKELIGAHELGHVLGLKDVDLYCSAYIDEYNYHHQEVLMGYGSPMSARSSDITYKDIAGVAITRGFHTDADHMWLNAGLQSDGTYKLICSICNGVKYVNSLGNYECDTYGECNNNHAPHSNNLMAVASYGDKDYYKCKYCRYVAPFSSIVSQNYIVEPAADGEHHFYTNNVPGLNYSFLEKHSWVDGECSVCGYEHPHTWEEGRCTGCGYVHPHIIVNGFCSGCGFEHTHVYSRAPKDGNYHITTCSGCGYIALESHFVKSSEITNGRYARCGGCGRLLDLNKDNAYIEPFRITKVSVNGSYILPSGIVVLVDEDVEAYLNGTLVFYDKDDVPVTE